MSNEPAIGDGPRPLRPVERGFAWPFEWRELLGDTDFTLAAIIAGVFLVLTCLSVLTAPGGWHYLLQVLVSINRQLVTLSTLVSVGLLGVVLAAIAILVSFADPELYEEMYAKEPMGFHRYIAVVFFPAKLAILDIVLILLILSTAQLWTDFTEVAAAVTFLLVLMASWMLTALYEAVHQIRASVVTRTWLGTRSHREGVGR